MNLNNGVDKLFLSIVLILLVAGLFILSSASLGLIAKNKTPTPTLIFKQFLFAVFGLCLLFVFSKIDYKKLRKWSILIFLASLILTLFVFIPPFGFSHGGARRWIYVGSFFFQPSEILKFGFILYLSAWLSSKKSNISSFQFGFLPFLAMIGIIAGVLILQPDIGTLGVIAISSGLLFFLGGGRLSQIGIIILLGVALLFLLSFFKPYLADRILVFLNPTLDPQGIGYQLNQSLIAIGSGGIFGRGFGMSVQKFNFLPEPTSDSIFSVFGEEFGFFGSIVLISLFLIFLTRGFFIAKNAPDVFGGLLTSGFVILITVEAFVNISALLGIIPLTGLPLVFISQGGTALVTTMAEVGVILNVSKHI